jgi:hypothetical protein
MRKYITKGDANELRPDQYYLVIIYQGLWNLQSTKTKNEGERREEVWNELPQ